MKIFYFFLITLSYSLQTFQVGGTIHITQQLTSPCQIIQYSANFKPLSISLQNKQLKSFFISTDLYNQCPSSCNKTSTYCTEGSSSFISQNISVCTDKIYVYLFPEKKHSSLQVTMTTDYLDYPCEGFDRDHNNFCVMLSENDCKKYCGLFCGTLHCMYEDPKDFKLKENFSMCLPMFTSEEELEKRCQASSPYTEKKWDYCHHEKKGGISVIWIMVIFLGSVLVGSFVGVLVWYRLMLKKWNRAPFRVPPCCPNFIFPRQPSETTTSLTVIEFD